MDQPKLMLATIKDNDVKQRSSRGSGENEQAKKANSRVVGDLPLHNVPSAVFGAVLVITFYLQFSVLTCGVFAVSSSITSWSAVCAWRERKKRLLEEEDEDATDGDIDWTRKIRVFVGDLGIEAFAKSGPSNDDGDDGAGYLRSLEQTGLLRDALLLYANRRWTGAKEPPAPAMTLQLIDHGTRETQGEDGKTHQEARQESIFLPLDRHFAASLVKSGRGSLQRATANNWRLSGFTRTVAAIGMAGPVSYAVGLWQRLLGQVVELAEEHEMGIVGVGSSGERYAALTDAGDVQLALVPRSSGASGGEREHGGSSSTSGSNGHSPGGGGSREKAEALLFIDAYGVDAFVKIQELVEHVMRLHAFDHPAPSVSAPEAAAPAAPRKQLFWFTLASWAEPNRKDNRSVLDLPTPVFHKKPIHA